MITIPISASLHRNLASQASIPIRTDTVLSARRNDIQCKGGRKWASTDEIVIRLEALGADTAVALEAAIGEAFLSEEFAVGASSVSGAFAGGVLELTVPYVYGMRMQT